MPRCRVSGWLRQANRLLELGALVVARGAVVVSPGTGISRFSVFILRVDIGSSVVSFVIAL